MFNEISCWDPRLVWDRKRLWDVPQHFYFSSEKRNRKRNIYAKETMQ